MKRERVGKAMLVIAAAGAVFGLMYGVANTWIEGGYVGWKPVLIFVGLVGLGVAYLITAVNLTVPK